MPSCLSVPFSHGPPDLVGNALKSRAKLHFHTTIYPTPTRCGFLSSFMTYSTLPRKPMRVGAKRKGFNIKFGERGAFLYPSSCTWLLPAALQPAASCRWFGFERPAYSCGGLTQLSVRRGRLGRRRGLFISVGQSMIAHTPCIYSSSTARGASSARFGYTRPSATGSTVVAPATVEATAYRHGGLGWCERRWGGNFA